MANFLGKKLRYSDDYIGGMDADHEIHEKHPEHVFSGLEAIEIAFFDQISPSKVGTIHFFL